MFEKIRLDHAPVGMELLLFYFGTLEEQNKEIEGLSYDENTKKYNYPLKFLYDTPYFWNYEELLACEENRVFTITDSNGLIIRWKKINKEIKFWLE